MSVHDWRSVRPEVMAGMYARESSRRQHALGWDMNRAWDTVEIARVTWGLPGLVYRSPAGEVLGWTFYMRTDAGIDVGGVVADSAAVTNALLDGLMAQTAPAGRWGGLLYASAPGLIEAAARRGIPFTKYAYRRRSLGAFAGAVGQSSFDARVAACPWPEKEASAVAALLAESYRHQGSPLGQGASVGQWSRYLTDLVRHSGCGEFMPSLSQVVRRTGDDGIVAAALVSVVGPDTAHLVQLAVSPALQGCGVGRGLLGRALSSARAAGFTSMSLLVSEDNRQAVRLYDAAGFADAGTFVQFGDAARHSHHEVPAPPDVSLCG